MMDRSQPSECPTQAVTHLDAASYHCSSSPSDLPNSHGSDAANAIPDLSTPPSRLRSSSPKKPYETAPFFALISFSNFPIIRQHYQIRPITTVSGGVKVMYFLWPPLYRNDPGTFKKGPIKRAMPWQEGSSLRGGFERTPVAGSLQDRRPSHRR